MGRLLLRQEVRCLENPDLPRLTKNQRWSISLPAWSRCRLDELTKELEGSHILIYYDFLGFLVTPKQLSPAKLKVLQQQITQTEQQDNPVVAVPYTSVVKIRDLSIKEELEAVEEVESELNKQWKKIRALSELNIKEQKVLLRTGVLKTRLKPQHIYKTLNYFTY